MTIPNCSQVFSGLDVNSRCCMLYAGAMQARVRCDDIANNIYVDGQRVGSTSYWTRTWKYDIADDAKIIAVNCQNTGSWGGLIASFDNGLTSDNTWRCSSNNESGWYDEDFDDSGWNTAYVIEENQWDNGGRSYEYDFPDRATWIWKDKNYYEATHAYCRGTIGE